MLIGQLAKAAEVSRDTVRFYEQIGLLEARRAANGYKVYPESALEMVRFVKMVQELGFSLAEIRSIAPLLAGGGVPAEQVEGVVREKIALIDERIRVLHGLRERLVNLPVGETCPLRRDCGIDGELTGRTAAAPG